MQFDLGRRGLLAGAAGGFAISSLPVAMAQQQDLIVNGYGGSWEKFWRDSLLPGFEAASGIKTKYDSGLARTWTANLRASGPDKTPYSFIMMNEIFAALLVRHQAAPGGSRRRVAQPIQDRSAHAVVVARRSRPTQKSKDCQEGRKIA